MVIATGSVLRRATPGALAEYLGLTVDNISERERCVDLETGRVKLEDDASRLLQNEDVKKAYLGG